MPRSLVHFFCNCLPVPYLIGLIRLVYDITTKLLFMRIMIILAFLYGSNKRIFRVCCSQLLGVCLSVQSFHTSNDTFVEIGDLLIPTVAFMFGLLQCMAAINSRRA